MSDEDHDVDIESDEDEDSLVSGTQYQYMTQAEKRAHHNALERKRRDHIKESFHNLRDSIPSLHGEKVSKEKIRSVGKAPLSPDEIGEIGDHSEFSSSMSTLSSGALGSTTLSFATPGATVPWKSSPSLTGLLSIEDSSSHTPRSASKLMLKHQRTTKASTSGQASRAQILKQATEYIQFMAKKNSAIQTDIDDLKRQNGTLEQQVRALEKAKMTGAFAAQSSSLSSSSASADNRSNLDASLSDSSDSENMTGGRKHKKLKTK